MKNEQAIDEQKIIWILKAVAIFFVAASHCGNLFTNIAYSGLNVAASNIVLGFGTIGVGLFYYLSGYLFSKNAKDLEQFLVRKLQTIIVPWLISSVCVYLYVVLRKGGASLAGWLKYFIGLNSFYYFLTVLLILYFLFWNYKKAKSIIYISAAVSIASSLLTAWGALLNISPYINPFNWAFFFALGLITANFGFLRLTEWCRKPIVIISAVLVVTLYIAYHAIYLRKSISYFQSTFFIFECAAIVFCIGIVGYTALHWKQDALVVIGKQSFAIYLYHMPFAGITSNLLNRVDVWWTTPLRPVIVIFVTFAAIYCCRKILLLLGMKKLCTIIFGSNASTDIGIRT